MKDTDPLRRENTRNRWFSSRALSKSYDFSTTYSPWTQYPQGTSDVPISIHASPLSLMQGQYGFFSLDLNCPIWTMDAAFSQPLRTRALLRQIPSLLYFSSLQNGLFPPHHRYLSPLSTPRGRSLCQASAWPLPSQDQQLWSHTEEPHKIGPTQFPHGGDIWPMDSKTKTQRAGEVVLPRAS